MTLSPVVKLNSYAGDERLMSGLLPPVEVMSAPVSLGEEALLWAT
jgi:hypothetical protein